MTEQGREQADDLVGRTEPYRNRARSPQQVIDAFLASENARLRSERDEARDCAIRQHQLLCRLLPDEVTRTAANLWPWLITDQTDETAPAGEQS